MVIQHLFPVFALVLLGVMLKHFRLTNDAFLSATDRIVYYVFFPILLFYKIGAATFTISPEMLRFYLSAVTAVMVIYGTSLVYIYLLKVPAFQAGGFSQSCYRFNTYVGMAVVLSVMGEQGVARFGILIGVLIPIINVLAVTTLIWFSGQPHPWRQRFRITAMSIITNPLIIACAAGLIYARWINTFPRFMDNTLNLASSVTLPLALISVGGGLTLSTLKRHMSLSLAGSLFKLVLLPGVGYACMRLFHISGTHLAVGLIFFGLPTSSAIYVLSSQLGSDTEFASAAIFLSTALSFFSLSVILWFLYG